MAPSKCDLCRTFSRAAFILAGLSFVAVPARAGDAQPSSVAKAPVSAEQKQQALSNYGRLPMSFEPNVGQVPGDARFVSHGRGYTVLLTDQGATVQMHKKGAPTSFRMKLLGSKPASASAADQLPGHSNYYIGSDPSKWHVGVPQFGKVVYQGVYDGIDEIYYGRQGQMEFDLSLVPRANLKQVRVGFEGIDRLELNRAGHLVLHLQDGEVSLKAPVAYQIIDGQKRPVEVAWRQVSASEAAFRAGQYDRNLPLVVDPILVYGDYIMAFIHSAYGFPTTLSGVGLDASGKAYAVGSSWETSDAGLYEEVAYIQEISADGKNLVYLTQIGGSPQVESLGGGSGTQTTGTAIAVDASGNVYITGNTNANNSAFAWMKTPPSSCNREQTPTACPDVLLAKLNPQGQFVYVQIVGGNLGTGIAVDGSGNAYVVGNVVSGSQFAATASAPQGSIAGTQNAFVSVFDANGDPTPTFSTFLGGSGTDTANSVTVDASGLIYITGSTTSNNFPTQNPLPGQGTLSGTENAFVSVVDPIGKAIDFSTYLGGNGSDQGFGIAVDSVSRIYVTGSTTSTNFPIQDPLQLFTVGPAANPGFQSVTPGSVDNTLLGAGPNAFVTKIQPVAQGVWTLGYSTYLGPTGTVGNGIAVDALGAAYAVGSTPSGVAFEPWIANDPTATPLADPTVFLSKFAPDPNQSGNVELTYSTVIAGSRSGLGALVLNASSLAIGPHGVTEVVGSTDLMDLIPSGTPGELTTNPISSSPDRTLGFVLQLQTGPACKTPFTVIGLTIVANPDCSTAWSATDPQTNQNLTVFWDQNLPGAASNATGGAPTFASAASRTATALGTYTIIVDPVSPAGLHGTVFGTIALNGAFGVSLSASTAAQPNPASTLTVETGQQVNLAASVSNASDESVTFSPAGAVTPSPVTSGITTATLSAPAAQVAPYVITATPNVCQVSPSACGTSQSSSVSLNIIQVTLEAQAAAATIEAGRTVSFTAFDNTGSTPTTPLTNVTWSINTCGVPSACGTINASTGLYQAPAALPSGTLNTVDTVQVSYTSAAGIAHTATTSVTVAAPPSVTVGPASVTLPAESKLTQQFGATVTNPPPPSDSTAVTWSVTGTGCNGGPCGSISASGMYAAPAGLLKGASSAMDTIVATAADGTTKGMATVTLVSSLAITVSPTPVALLVMGGPAATQTFTAAVAPNSVTQNVTWSVTGTGCNGKPCGTINASTGVYTAPATLPSAANFTDTVVATSTLDNTSQGTVAVTLAPPPAISVSPVIDSVTGGQPATYKISIPANPAVSQVFLQCVSSTLPAGASCSAASFNPNPVAAGQTSFLTITTSGMGAARFLPTIPAGRGPSQPALYAGLCALAGLALIGLTWRTRKQIARLAMACAVVGFAATLASCGGAGTAPDPGTTYTVTVQAVNATPSTAVYSSVNLTLTVH